jgi:hypothetical protein
MILNYPKNYYKTRRQKKHSFRQNGNSFGLKNHTTVLKTFLVYLWVIEYSPQPLNSPSIKSTDFKRTISPNHENEDEKPNQFVVTAIDRRLSLWL